MVKKTVLYLLNKFLINKSKLKRYILSALSAFVGIQSNKNRKIDFASNNPFGFIIAGAAVRNIPAKPDSTFLEALERAVAYSVPKPTALVLNFPNNPTAELVDLDF